MTRILLLYLATFAVFLVIDLVWLGVVSRNFYRSQLGNLMTDSIVWGAAILFYLLFVAGLVLFAVLPALDGGGWIRALALGAAFGFFAYMTYDLTNLATLRDWPLTLTVVDIGWGTILGGVVATAGYVIGTRLPPA